MHSRQRRWNSRFIRKGIALLCIAALLLTETLPLIPAFADGLFSLEHTVTTVGDKVNIELTANNPPDVFVGIYSTDGVTETLLETGTTYTYEASANGYYRFFARGEDDQAAPVETATIEVFIADFGPSAFTLGQGESKTIDMQDYFADDVSGVTFSASGFTKGGALVTGSVITYTADADALGADSLTVSADFTVDGAPAAFTWPVDILITFDPSGLQTHHDIDVLEGGEASFDLSATLPAGHTYAYSIASAPLNGMAEVDALGEVTYRATGVPAATDSFSVLIEDEDGVLGGDKTVTVDAAWYGTPEIGAEYVGFAADEDAVDHAYQLAGSDPYGRPLQWAVTMQPQNGTASISASGELLYTPNADYNGTDSVIVSLANKLTSVTRVLNITVTAQPDAPEAVDDTASVRSDNTAGILIDVLANDRIVDDAPGVSLAIKEVTQPGAGEGTASVEDGKIRYIPDPRNQAPVTFTYTVYHVGGDESLLATGTVTVTINYTNQAPALSADPVSYVIDEDDLLTVTFTLSDADAADIENGYTIDISSSNEALFSNSSRGTMQTVSAGTAIDAGKATYTFTWQPEPYAYGAAELTIVATDKSDPLSEATLNIPVTVTPVNNDPAITKIDLNTWTMLEDGVYPVTVRVEDPDADPMTDFTLVAVSSDESVLQSGKITVAGPVAVIGNPRAADYTLTFQPEKDQNTESGVTITITAGDGHGGSATAAFSLVITPVNDDPKAKDYTRTIFEDAQPQFDVLDDATDVDIATNGDVLTISSVSSCAVAGSTTRISGDGRSIIYIPQQDYSGKDSFTYTIIDSGGLVATGTVTLTITPLNDAPVFVGVPTGTPGVTDPMPATMTVLENDIAENLRLPFVVDDVDSDISALMASASIKAHTPKIVYRAYVEPGSTQNERVLVIELVPYQNGEALVTLSVTDT
ncbi:Ig-like domain-containing protein, partial [Oscillospiraceae bacterium OttesenSCG-928-F05]|nr:Ig-like domain-containing protein [Oscillospiraceae bacterium OttesenSCG-928-F05]